MTLPKPLLLAQLRFRMARHRVWPAKPVTWLFLVGFSILGALFLLGDFFFFRRIFANLLDNEEIPKVLLLAVAAKLMGLVLLTTFTLLLFSAAVSALSYLYLDEDLSLLLALPLPRWQLRVQRATEASLNAGYMVALLLLPILAAYWSLFPAAWASLLSGITGLLLYLSIPLAWGVCFTVLLARFFPAKRLHQMLTVLTVVMVCLLVILFRLARPEALLNPESSPQLVAVLNSIQMPRESYLPSTWLAQLVVRGAEGDWHMALRALASLALLACFSGSALLVLLRVFHWRGYSRAQEQGNVALGRKRGTLGPAILSLVLAPVPGGRTTRALLRRDVLLFFRDPTQWGQLIILAALVVIYLFNVRYMPTGMAVFRVAVAFWNLATLGLIVSSVAGRFAFTAVGAEGRAYFATRALPVGVWPYLWAKYLFTAVPLSALAALTLYGSNRFLGVSGAALEYTVFLAVWASLALAALALAIGTVEPIFDSKNPAKAVMSAWGLTYMFLSLIYVGGLLVLSARPVYEYYAVLVGGRSGVPNFRMAALDVGGLSAIIVLASFLFAGWRLKGLQIR